ncbi:STAS domain-containing protein [Arcicella rigui]|uniref:STAS domain-containing protein n=1 Tax=Arcicella rigui TaxID=797020 RepID=A0ABU5QH56_9BACT|nr:STAS domain-containing protein [Arcicella rigui]MEA5141862.1 STAS domain-containing protein [Arcicella rigui]
MEFKVEKNEQYALIELKETALTQENYADLEKIVRQLFREGYGNIIIEFNKVTVLDGYGVSVIRKANKICLNELGLLIIVTKNQEIIDQLDAAKIDELTVMPTVQEAVDAVYLNELENDFQSDEDDEYDHGEYGGASDDDY